MEIYRLESLLVKRCTRCSVPETLQTGKFLPEVSPIGGHANSDVEASEPNQAAGFANSIRCISAELCQNAYIQYTLTVPARGILTVNRYVYRYAKYLIVRMGARRKGEMKNEKKFDMCRFLGIYVVLRSNKDLRRMNRCSLYFRNSFQHVNSWASNHNRSTRET